jgi:hypothetical protein
MAAPPPQSDVHTGISDPHAKPIGVSAPVAHGNITDESHSTTLQQLGKDNRDARLTKKFTGKRDYTPTQAKSWVGVVTAQLRMMSLYEIWEDVQSYQGTHLALIQDIIDKEGGEMKLKEYQIPVVCVRVPEIEKGTPAPRRSSCLDVSLDSKDPNAWQQRKYIGLGSFKNRQGIPLPPVGSTVRVSCDNDYFYSHDGKYNGYFTEIITINPTRTLKVHIDCSPDSPEGSFDGKKKPQELADTVDASAKAEPAPTGGWYGADQPKGKDGQRALNRGGLVDFTQKFWGSATKSYGGGEDSGGKALIGQERTQSLRSQKPSNQ